LYPFRIESNTKVTIRIFEYSHSTTNNQATEASAVFSTYYKGPVNGLVLHAIAVVYVSCSLGEQED